MMETWQIDDRLEQILGHFEVNTMFSTRDKLKHRLLDLVQEAMRSVKE